MTLVRPAARRIRWGERATNSDVTTITLDDARTVTVRPLTSLDADALDSFLHGEDADDLRRRFLGQPPPTAYLLARLCAADGFHDLVVGAFTSDGRLVAVAQFDREGEGSVAEFAIEVAHDWQRHHLGTQLLRRLAQLARERGVSTFTATYFADNFGIRRLLRGSECVVSSDVEFGEGHARLDLDRPT